MSFERSSLTLKVKNGTLSLGMNTEETTEIKWRSCSHISIDGDTLQWELSDTKRYGILEAYSRGRPHREFMAAGSDDRLKLFVRKWGPLRHPPQERTGRDSVQWYRDVRDDLTATVGLIGAIGDRSKLRPALLNVIRLREFSLNSLNTLLQMTRRWNAVCSDPEKWCENAPVDEIEALCEQFVNEFPLAWGPRFVVVKRNRRNVVRSSLFINNLLEALPWMVWQDIFREEPFSFCQDCGNFILREGGREWKFCDSVCAKRNADRKSWRRRHGKNLRYRGGEWHGSL